MIQLYDFRRRVFAMYRERNEALLADVDPVEVCRRFRNERDELFASHPQSAYDEEQRRAFRGLEYFPYDPEACVEAVVETNVEPRRLLIETSDDASVPMTRVGVLRFSIGSDRCELSLYWIDVYGGGLFLPFRDATAPADTYGGGRYLFDTVKGSDFIQLPDRAGEVRLLLDFNYAYNPSCAYNYWWSCPLAPPENRLSVYIRAGEKTPP
jgi:uncharacterized protein (DUF1684 family)